VSRESSVDGVAGQSSAPRSSVRGVASRTTGRSAAGALALVWLGYQFALNAAANLGARNIASGLGFFDNTAGFGINQSLIAAENVSAASKRARQVRLQRRTDSMPAGASLI